MDDDIDAAIEVTREAVIAAAERQGFHQPEDAWTFIDDKANVTDEASIERAVKHLAKEKPFLVDPVQEPAPPPTPGHVTVGGRGQPRRRPTPNEQMRDIFQSMRPGRRR